MNDCIQLERRFNFIYTMQETTDVRNLFSKEFLLYLKTYDGRNN